MTEHNRRLLAHLMRRAGFGATSSELDELSEISYEEVVDNLLDPLDESWMGEHLIRRFHHEQSGMMSAFGPSEYWLYYFQWELEITQKKISRKRRGHLQVGV